jgi:hypothetical protein
MKFEVIVEINDQVTVFWDMTATQAALDEYNALILHNSTPLN